MRLTNLLVPGCDFLGIGKSDRRSPGRFSRRRLRASTRDFGDLCGFEWNCDWRNRGRLLQEEEGGGPPGFGWLASLMRDLLD